MPKPPPKVTKAMEDSDGDGGRAPVPEAYYLLKVESDEEYQGSEFDGVKMKFRIVEPRGYKGKVLYDRFSYNPAAGFKWRQLYDAAGYEYDSDTAELVENQEMVVAYVVQNVIESGKSKGKIGNNIDEYFEPNDENRSLVAD